MLFISNPFLKACFHQLLEFQHSWMHGSPPQGKDGAGAGDVSQASARAGDRIGKEPGPESGLEAARARLYAVGLTKSAKCGRPN